MKNDYSGLSKYERAPEGDKVAVLIVLLIVSLAFSAFTALTERPEDCLIEAAGQTIYQLKN